MKTDSIHKELWMRRILSSPEKEKGDGSKQRNGSTRPIQSNISHCFLNTSVDKCDAQLNALGYIIHYFGPAQYIQTIWLIVQSEGAAEGHMV